MFFKKKAIVFLYPVLINGFKKTRVYSNWFVNRNVQCKNIHNLKDVFNKGTFTENC